MSLTLGRFIGGTGVNANGAIFIGGQKTPTQLIKSLFANNEQGFAYDPNDLTTMYQDAAGTIPVTGAGQPVGLMLDKGRGLSLGVNIQSNGDGSSLVAWGTIYGAIPTLVGGTIRIVGAGTGTGITAPVIPIQMGKFYSVKIRVKSDVATTSVSLAFRRLSAIGVNTSVSTMPLNLTTEYSEITGFLYSNSSATDQCIFFRFTANEVINVDWIEVQEITGNHAHQTQSSMRPLLVASPQRLDYDTADDKLITTLPAQLTGCTVIRSVPNVGTQILTNQTIPTPYNDNTDHCGLIAINRALTATETSQITKLFNKDAGV